MTNTEKYKAKIAGKAALTEFTIQQQEFGSEGAHKSTATYQ